MDYVYSFLFVYGFLCLYAFLMEVPRRRSPWEFILIYSLTFPILLVMHLASEWRMFWRRKNGIKQNQNP